MSHAYHFKAIARKTCGHKRIWIEQIRSDSSIDAVVTDYKMPEMTGLELAKALYEIRPIPIWIATGYSDRLTQDALREAHVLRVLSKPFELSYLHAMIADVSKKPA